MIFFTATSLFYIYKLHAFHKYKFSNMILPSTLPPSLPNSHPSSRVSFISTDEISLQVLGVLFASGKFHVLTLLRWFHASSSLLISKCQLCSVTIFPWVCPLPFLSALLTMLEQPFFFPRLCLGFCNVFSGVIGTAFSFPWVEAGLVHTQDVSSVDDEDV